MRCNNCGWDNGPGSSVCVKCGHTLQAGDVQYQEPTPAPRPTVLNSQQAEPAPRPTRIVNSSDLQNQASLKATVAQAPKNCPHCGYPVVGNFASCPNCGASFGSAPTTIQNAPEKKVESFDLEIGEVKCDKCGATVSTDFSFCPKCGERIHLPTVRAIRHKPAPAPEPPKPQCHLTIIPEEGEITEPFKNDYEGDSIILNRENTEQDNRTITSKEQAELICENGQWYLLNHSELGSTYLEANRKLSLEPGDVIVLGDRRFRFETE